MKKTFVILITLFILLGCTTDNNKFEEATITPESTVISTEDPKIESPNIDNVIDENKETDTQNSWITYLCPCGNLFYWEKEISIDEANKYILAITLEETEITITAYETGGIFFKGIYKQINDNLYSYYGYSFTVDERSAMDGGGGLDFDESWYDKSSIKYFVILNDNFYFLDTNYYNNSMLEKIQSCPIEEIDSFIPC